MWFDLTRPQGGYCRFYMDRNAIEAPKLGHDARQKKHVRMLAKRRRRCEHSTAARRIER